MNQEQFLARRDELARAHHLGGLVMYRTPWLSEGWVIYARVIAIVALALLGLVMFLISRLNPLVFAVLLLLGYLYLMFFYTYRTSVYVYSKGLVCLWRGGSQVVPWEAIHMVGRSGGGRREPVLYARLQDGTTITFPVISSLGSASYGDIQQFIEGNIERGMAWPQDQSVQYTTMADETKDQEGTEEYHLTLDRDIIGGQTPGEP